MTVAAALNVEEVAHRLGVKRETVYAYVSRGRLPRDPSSTRRASRFAPEAVERLAEHTRHGERSGALEVVIETELTALDPAGRLAYRGRDVVELARFRSFEDVAGLLWDGDAHAPWTLPAPECRALARVRGALPTDAPAADLIPAAVTTLAARDPERAERHPDAIRRAGARMLAGALQIMSPDSEGAAAARLWEALGPSTRTPRPDERAALGASARTPRTDERAALDAALVLLADHELAASTLAARVAASTWADPYRVVLAGLGPLGGPLHGGAGTAAEALFTDAARLGPFPALDARLAADAGGRTLSVPGFGHRVYRDRDPRGDHLLARLRTLGEAAGSPPDRSARVRVVLGLLDAAGQLGLPAPNVDLGLAGLTWALGLAPGAATTVFTFARMAGLIAHALEEYPHRLRFRPRATYVGPALRT